MAAMVGADAKLYYNSGTNASPTWVLMEQVGDVSIPDLGVNLAEVNIRENGWVMNLAARKKAAIEFSLLYNRGNTAFDAIQAAFIAETVYQWAVMDGPIATVGSEGLKAFCISENFAINQALDEAVTADVRLALAYAEESSAVVDPTWTVISS